MMPLPTNRKPFSAKSFLAERLAIKGFQKEMLAGGAEDFSGGYFPKDASPFTLFKDGITKRTYLKNLHRYLNGIADSMSFYLITQDESVQHELGLYLTKEELVDFEKRRDEANEDLRPRTLLDNVKYDALHMNEIITRAFGFDFREAAAKVETLFEALNNAEIHNIKPYQRVIIKRGPKTLREVEGMHEAITQFMEEAEVETQHQYPAIADKLKQAMDVVINRLEWHINAAMVGAKGRGNA